MERRLKERLIGAAVLVMLAVIFIPMILDDSVENDTSIRSSNIPPRPQAEFSSRISPLTEAELDLAAAPEEVAVLKDEPTVLLDEIPALLPEPAPLSTQPEAQLPASSAQSGTQPDAKSATKPDEKPSKKPGTQPASAPPDVPSKPAAESTVASAWVVQLGSFSSAVNADALNQRLRAAAYPSFVETLRQQSGKMAYRVRVGPELLRSDAQALKERLDETLKKDGIQGMVVRYP